jgi:lysophospholipase L1-like esterase
MVFRRIVLGVVVAVGGLCWMSKCSADAPTTAPTTWPTTKISFNGPNPEPEPADVPDFRHGKYGEISPPWEKKHDKNLARAKAGNIDLLFMGDSITDFWATTGKEVWDKYYGNLNAADFGISGDLTQHVLWRIENGELDGISPRVLVLLIGTNNYRYTAEHIYLADVKIVKEIHEKLPQTKVLVLGIFPRGADPNDPVWLPIRTKYKLINLGLSQLDDGNKTRFLDIGDKFLDAEGNIPVDIMKDGLHPTAKGYQIWADAMAPLLNQMMQN